MRTLFSALIISISFAAALRPAVAADLKLGSTDTVQTALTAQRARASLYACAQVRKLPVQCARSTRA